MFPQTDRQMGLDLCTLSRKNVNKYKYKVRRTNVCCLLHVVLGKRISMMFPTDRQTDTQIKLINLLVYDRCDIKGKIETIFKHCCSTCAWKL